MKKSIIQQASTSSLPVFGTYLSNRKQANSTSSPASPSVLQSKVKAKLRFTLILEQTLSACHFASLGLYFLFFQCYVCICNFLQPEWRPVAVFYLLSTSPASFRFLEDSPTRNVPTKQKHQNPGEGEALQTHSPPHMYRGYACDVSVGGSHCEYAH